MQDALVKKITDIAISTHRDGNEVGVSFDRSLSNFETTTEICFQMATTGTTATSLANVSAERRHAF